MTMQPVTPRLGHAWDINEQQQLIEELRCGMDWPDIAAAHGRSIGSIRSRASLLLPDSTTEAPPSSTYGRAALLRARLAQGDDLPERAQTEHERERALTLAQTIALADAVALTTRHRSPQRPTIYTDPEVIDRFWSQVDDTGYCWPWTGSTSHGYGTFYIPRTEQRRRRTIRAHRFAYRITYGPIQMPELDHVCHSTSRCTRTTDCPHRRCVNPDHLEPVPGRENRRRARRNYYDQTRRYYIYCPNGHRWADNALYDVNGARYCHDCIAGLY